MLSLRRGDHYLLGGRPRRGRAVHFDPVALGAGPLPYASARLMADRWLALVRVTGKIDLCTAPQLLVAVNKGFGDGACSIFVDLAQVSFFGAAGAMARLVAGGVPTPRCRVRAPPSVAAGSEGPGPDGLCAGHNRLRGSNAAPVTGRAPGGPTSQGRRSRVRGTPGP